MKSLKSSEYTESPNQATSSELLKGAAVLSVAAIITKLLGTLQKIPLQNIGGDSVFGIYNTVYPFYTILITLATAGFPTVVSKFVAERHVTGSETDQREVLRIATIVMVVLGVAGFILMYFGAPYLGTLIGNSHLVPALRSAAPALLFIPLGASIRGYFQGLQNMMPTAVSQVIEQAMRVTIMIILLLYLSNMNASDSLVAGGAMAGSAVGGAAGLIVLLIYWRKHIQQNRPVVRRDNVDVTASGYQLLREMLYYAIPICLATLAVPLISLVDTFTLPRLLSHLGDEMGTMALVGVYNRGIPLVQLVTMLASSLSVLFIPVLAEMNLRGQQEGIRRQTGLALKWFWLLGLSSSAGLAILAGPINVMLYGNLTGTSTMAWVAWTAAPGALVSVSAALLQGLGMVKAPALNLLAAAAMKTALNLLLVPQLGITGAAIAGIAAYSVAAALNIALLLRHAGLRPSVRDAALRPVAAILAMMAAVLLLRLGADAVLPHSRLIAAAVSLLGVLLGAAVFASAVLRTRLVSATELAALPRIGPKLLKVLRRLHWVR